ncbi:MAG: hypothetical protein RLZZ600_1169, partial [Actinomycetota bacterium]
MFDIIPLGFNPNFVDYIDGWEIQRKVHAEVVSGVKPNTLLLLEHDSVYTAGK